MMEMIKAAYQHYEVWEEMSRQLLDQKKVDTARNEEMEFFRKYQVYVKVPINECWEVTGKPPTRHQVCGNQQGGCCS